MLSRRIGAAALLVTALGGCGGLPQTGSAPARTEPVGTPSAPPESAATTSPASASPSIATPSARTILVDTDVAPDDLIALSFLLRAPNVTVAAITVSGTGEAHCAGGVAVVLGLLEYLKAPPIAVACGRATPLAGVHAFPGQWREGADRGSGFVVPATTRVPVEGNAVELIKGMAGDFPGLEILTLGPLTNLGDALSSTPGLADRLGPVFIMGGALYVPGNIVGPGAPTGNAVAEWNVYVDPHAVNVVLDAGLDVTFVSLDGTSHVPVTTAFAQRAIQTAFQPASSVLAQLMNANPFMTDGSYFLWDPLAAEVAAGYAVGTVQPALVTVEEAEGPQSGFTRSTSGEPNCHYLATADATDAENTLLAVLNAP